MSRPLSPTPCFPSHTIQLFLDKNVSYSVVVINTDQNLLGGGNVLVRLAASIPL